MRMRESVTHVPRSGAVSATGFRDNDNKSVTTEESSPWPRVAGYVLRLAAAEIRPRSAGRDAQPDHRMLT